MRFDPDGRCREFTDWFVRQEEERVGAAEPVSAAATPAAHVYIRQPSTAMYRVAIPFGLTRITGDRQVEGTSNESSLIRASPLRLIGTCPVVAAAVVSVSCRSRARR